MPLAHLEAGLRSFNRRMPEEHNRVLTDHAADLLLAPTEVAMEHLAARACERPLVGDVMTDVCLQVRDAVARQRAAAPRRRRPGRATTSSRRSTGPRTPTIRSGCAAIVEALAALPVPVVLLAHPRLVAGAAEPGIDLDRGVVRAVEPLAYPEMVAAVLHARGRGHRLRRPAEGGLPPADAVHDAAHRDRVDRDASTAAGTCSTPTWHGLRRAVARPARPGHRAPYGDGHAAEAVVEALEDLLTARPR